MHEIKINAPGNGDCPYATLDEVRKFMGGIGDDKLAKILKDYPWVRTRQLGIGKQFNVEDIALVSKLIDLKNEAGGEVS